MAMARLTASWLDCTQSLSPQATLVLAIGITTPCVALTAWGCDKAFCTAAPRATGTGGSKIYTTSSSSSARTPTKSGQVIEAVESPAVKAYIQDLETQNEALRSSIGKASATATNMKQLSSPSKSRNLNSGSMSPAIIAKQKEAEALTRKQLREQAELQNVEKELARVRSVLAR